jgi:NAD(P)-dependent dehydrogenase (short-subunit alcohol dehydrogenase family)
MDDLTGKWALVTGAAKRVGKTIATHLAEQGCNIWLHYGRSKSEAEQTMIELQAKGVDIQLVQCDFTNPEQVYTMMRAIDHLDILVNSASIFPRSPFMEIRLLEWQEAINVNLTSPFLLAQQAAKLMLKTSGDKLIVNIGDGAGIHPWVNFAAHGVSKAGLIHLTKIMARALAPQIRVNCIIPGPVLIPKTKEEDSEYWARITGKIPLQRSGTPIHIAHTVEFLARNDFITGAILPVDGGESLIVR